ncbi:DUF541 domain-containing protein [Salipiger sp. IMCC34102]|uniref:SIMPL domain-containing protein n=1 Tax=Salipiger sp. IMCC34102 TaxID=2510647 RepID=UPI00101D4E59|nr:SIMPL domain-containing protein [Salipiger sp. IMCC34102]RYH01796.1 DUF541 domain-containing protein [Salipiger sp. IMCC34102]
MVLPAKPAIENGKSRSRRTYSRNSPGPRWRTGALAAVLCTLAGAAAAQEGGLTVTGHGEVMAVPDMARISLGVTQEAETAQAAMTAMSADMRDVMAAIAEAGLEDRDIQTGSLRLDLVQQYDRETGESTITGYRASTDVDLRVRVLDDLGPVLDAVVGEGATQISGLVFDVADRSGLLDEARRSAVADARAKAELYADAAGVTLGSISEMRETETVEPPRPMMRMAMDQEGAGPPIAAGELAINADVTVTWDLGA